MTDRAEVMLVGNDTAVNVKVSNVGDYRDAAFFVRTHQIEDPETPLRDASLTHLLFLPALFRMQGLDFSRPLLVTSHPRVSADDVTTP